MKRVYYVMAILLLGLLVWGCAAQRQAAPMGMVQTLKRIQGEEYPDANAVVVFDSIRVDLQRSGKYTQREHKLVKILTEQGKENYSEATFGYFVSYDTVMVTMARVIGRGGTMIDIPSDQIKDIPFPAFGKFFLPNVREKIIIFPNLVLGSSIEFISKEIMRNPPMEENFDVSLLFEGMDPLSCKVFELVTPKEMEVKHLVKNGKLNFSRQELGDKVLYRWEAKDVPRIISEPGMPPLWDVATKLLITTVPSWENWSRWYYQMASPTFEADQAIKDKVTELTSGLQTEEEKIRALYYFVSQKIRYVGTSMSGKEAGYKPFPAPKTFKQQFGVCRDKAALLVSMLKVLGVDAYIVLTNPAWRVDREIPVDQFNHAIVAIKNSEGKFWWLDPTFENTREFLSPFEQNKAVLVCDQQGEDLDFTPIIPPTDGMAHIKATSNLKSDGSLESQVIIEPNGSYDVVFRSWLKRIPPMQREMMFQGLFQSVSPGAMVKNIEISDLSDLYTPVKIEIDYTVADYWMKAGDYYLFSAPTAVGTFDFLSYAFLRGANLPQREYPLNIRTTFGSCMEEEINLPQGFTLKALPPNMQKDYPHFSFQASYQTQGKKVIFTRRVLYHRPEITLDEYGDLRDMLQGVERSTKGKIILVSNQNL